MTQQASKKKKGKAQHLYSVQRSKAGKKGAAVCKERYGAEYWTGRLEKARAVHQANAQARASRPTGRAVLVHIAMKPAEREKLKQLTEQLGVPRSTLIRMALTRAMRQVGWSLSQGPGTREALAGLVGRIKAEARQFQEEE